MAKVVINTNNEIETPTLILQNRNFDNIGSITEASDFNYKENFNAANECSFTIYKNIEKFWDDVVDHKVIYIPEFSERFEAKVSISEEDSLTKTITLTSLCEAELGQIILRDVQINTEGDDGDIARDDYYVEFPTVFYRDPDNIAKYNDIWNNPEISYKFENADKSKILRDSSLLHRLLSDKCPHYTIGHVDDTLKDIQRTFSISDTSVYDELTGEISEEIGCLFVFDSMTRTINAYDLYSTCNECGFRGDFIDKCPECGSENIIESYGEDTTIYIDSENIASSVSLETNADSIKNCFYVTGGDDLINAAFRQINPSGNEYIYRFSEQTLSDMPDEMIEIIKQYQFDYTVLMYEWDYDIDDKYYKVIDSYNKNVVDYIHKYFPDKEVKYIGQQTEYLDEWDYCIRGGYTKVIEAMYNTIDAYVFLNNSMMPTIDINGIGIEEAAKMVKEGIENRFVKPSTDPPSDDKPEFLPISAEPQLPLYKPASASQSTAEKSIEKTAKLFCSPAYYSVDVVTDKDGYIQAKKTKSGSWSGTITLTSLVEKQKNSDEYVKKDIHMKLIIPNESEDSIDGNYYLEYSQQVLQHALADKDKLSEKQITSLKLSANEFKTQLKYYSLVELNNLYSCFQACYDIVIKSGETWEKLGKIDGLYEKYKKFYEKRMGYIQNEVKGRENQLSTIYDVYNDDYIDYKDNKMPNSAIGLIMYNVKNYINIKKRLGDYYNTFCAYRREDSYNNSNYTSDNADNAELINRSANLYTVATRELYKASEPQYTLSSSIGNLLIIDDFIRIRDKFKVGNWIKLGVDDHIYKLRLLSYSYNIDSIESLDVEFSTVEKIWTGYSDIQSVISSASSMATSYDAVMHQYDKTKDNSDTIDNWLTKGFNATVTKFVNSDEQEVIIDESGILLRRRVDSIEEGYEDYQARILSNGLYTTCDNWETVDAGIGRLSFLNPENGEYEETYGIIAKTVIGQLFIGENLKIYSDNNNMSFDSNGLKITSSTNSVTINPNIETNNGILFRIKKDTEDLLYTDSDGNLIISGKINATSFTAYGDAKNILTTIGDNIIIKASRDDFLFGVTPYIECQNTLSGSVGGTKDYRISRMYGDKIAFSDSKTFSRQTSISFASDGLTINSTSSSNANLLVYGNISNEKDIYLQKDKVHGITPSGLDYEITHSVGVYCGWIDGNEHTLLSRSSNGTTASVGWAGTSSVVTKLNLHGQSVVAPDCSGAAVVSDARLKNSFKTLDEFDDVFMNIKPYAFKYNNGTSGRFHFGAKAQDIRDAFLNKGYTTNDFGGFVQYNISKNDDDYQGVTDPMGLIYTEFTMWNTHMIQKAIKLIESQQKEIDALKKIIGKSE